MKKFATLFFTLLAITAFAGSLKSEELGNGVGYSGAGGPGCWVPAYQLDPEFACADGSRPGYRSMLLPLEGPEPDGSCHRKDACTGAIEALPAGPVSNSWPYHMQNVEYDEQLMAYENEIYDLLLERKHRVEAWCTGYNEAAKIAQVEVVIRKVDHQLKGTVVYQQEIGKSKDGQLYSVRKVMPIELTREDQQLKRIYSRDGMSLELFLDQPVDWSPATIHAAFRASIDGKEITTQEMNCSWVKGE